MPINTTEKRRRRVARGLPAISEVQAESGRIRQLNRTKRARDFIDSLKLSAGCADCGYRSHPAALDFDHLPGAKKIATLARLSWIANMAAIREEVLKCEVVCANCHRIRTVERRKARNLSFD